MTADLPPPDRSSARDTAHRSGPASRRSHEPSGPAPGNEPSTVVDDHQITATDDVIDVQAVARLLHVGRNTVYVMVARNAIPHRRLGEQIRFSRDAIIRWFASWSSQGAKEGQ